MSKSRKIIYHYRCKMSPLLDVTQIRSIFIVEYLTIKSHLFIWIMELHPHLKHYISWFHPRPIYTWSSLSSSIAFPRFVWNYLVTCHSTNLTFNYEQNRIKAINVSTILLLSKFPITKIKHVADVQFICISITRTFENIVSCSVIPSSGWIHDILLPI